MVQCKVRCFLDQHTAYASPYFGEQEDNGYCVQGTEGDFQ